MLLLLPPGTGTGGSSNNINNNNNSNNNNNEGENQAGLIGELFAMKVFRSGKKYDYSAMHEWDILQALTICTAAAGASNINNGGGGGGGRRNFTDNGFFSP